MHCKSDLNTDVSQPDPTWYCIPTVPLTALWWARKAKVLSSGQNQTPKHQ